MKCTDRIIIRFFSLGIFKQRRIRAKKLLLMIKLLCRELDGQGIFLRKKRTTSPFLTHHNKQNTIHID